MNIIFFSKTHPHWPPYVHNPHSTNCKKGKLERNLIMSFPSLNSITLRKEFRAGAVNTLQSSSSSDAHCTQGPHMCSSFCGTCQPHSNLCPCHCPRLEPTSPDPVQLTSLVCTITPPKDFLDLSAWNTQESTHLFYPSFQHKLHKNRNMAVLSWSPLYSWLWD